MNTTTPRWISLKIDRINDRPYLGVTPRVPPETPFTIDGSTTTNVNASPLRIRLH